MPSIIITGAQQGLGLGLVDAYLQRGWHVTATVLPDADRVALVALASDHPDRLVIEPLDVTDREAIAPFLDSLDSLGDRRFDVVFSNAGIWGRLDQDLAAATDEDLATVMLTNCFGPVRLARRLIDRLVEPGGTLAFMSCTAPASSGTISARWTSTGRARLRSTCWPRAPGRRTATGT